MKYGFDNEKYVKIQSEKIKERFKLFDKLYLEIGGKLFDDYHASRVLPGFKSDAKISMFQELKDDLEIIFCINAGHTDSRYLSATERQSQCIPAPEESHCRTSHQGLLPYLLLPWQKA